MFRSGSSKKENCCLRIKEILNKGIMFQKQNQIIILYRNKETIPDKKTVTCIIMVLKNYLRMQKQQLPHQKGET